MISRISRGVIQDPAVEREIEHIVSRLRGLLSLVLNEDSERIVDEASLALVPVGGILLFGGSTTPAGYLRCDGATVSRVTYQALFLVIGTTYGAGDGLTTFGLPTVVDSLVFAGV